MQHEITIPITEYDYLRECKKAIEGLTNSKDYFVISYNDGHWFHVTKLLKHGKNPHVELMLLLGEKDRTEIELRSRIRHLEDKIYELGKPKWYQFWK